MQKDEQDFGNFGLFDANLLAFSLVCICRDKRNDVLSLNMHCLHSVWSLAVVSTKRGENVFPLRLQ